MTLPLSRNTTYSNGTPVEAADLNEYQDAIVGHKSGPRTDWFGVGGINDDIGTSWGGGGASASSYIASASSEDLYHVIELPIGAIVTAVVIWVKPNAAGAIQILLSDTIITTGVRNAARTPLTTSGTARQGIVWVEDLPITLTDRYFDIYASSGQASDAYYGAAITWYMP